LEKPADCFYSKISWIFEEGSVFVENCFSPRPLVQPIRDMLPGIIFVSPVNFVTERYLVLIQPQQKNSST